MYELWGEGSSYEELEDSIKSYPEDRKLPFLDSGSTFKINVDSFGKVISLEDQNQRIHGLSYIPFKVSFMILDCIANFFCECFILNMYALQPLSAQYNHSLFVFEIMKLSDGYLLFSVTLIYYIYASL